MQGKVHNWYHLVSEQCRQSPCSRLASLIVHTVKAGSLNAGTERHASGSMWASQQVARCLVTLQTVAAVCASLQPSLARLARHCMSVHMHILHYASKLMIMSMQCWVSTCIYAVASDCLQGCCVLHYLQEELQQSSVQLKESLPAGCCYCISTFGNTMWHRPIGHGTIARWSSDTISGCSCGRAPGNTAHSCRMGSSSRHHSCGGRLEKGIGRGVWMQASRELLEGDWLDGQDFGELSEEVCNVEHGCHMIRLLGWLHWRDRHVKATCNSNTAVSRHTQQWTHSKDER